VVRVRRAIKCPRIREARATIVSLPFAPSARSRVYLRGSPRARTVADSPLANARALRIYRARIRESLDGESTGAPRELDLIVDRTSRVSRHPWASPYRRFYGYLLEGGERIPLLSVSLARADKCTHGAVDES